MRALESVPDHPHSAALGINHLGDAVGACGTSVRGFACRHLAEGRRGLDLNELFAAPTPLYLMTVFGIDDAGRIVGFAFDTESEQVHAFLAPPTRRR